MAQKSSMPIPPLKPTPADLAREAAEAERLEHIEKAQNPEPTPELPAITSEPTVQVTRNYGGVNVPVKQKEKKSVMIRLDPDIDKQLTRYAGKFGTTRSAIVEELIKNWISNL